MSEIETKQCDKCEGIKYHNKGIGKQSGRAYENWKCNKCEDIEWLSDKPKTQNIRQNQRNIAPKSNEEYQNLLAAMRELYVLVKAAALQTTTERDLNDMIMKLKEGK